MKRFHFGFLALALAACSNDNAKTSDGGADNDAAINTSGTGGAHGGSGSGGKAGGAGGSRTGGGGGSGGKAGTGSSGSSGSSGGSGNSGSGGANDGDDGGDNPGMPGSHTMCKAPTPAQSAGNACPDHDPVALKATLVKNGFNTAVFVTYAPGDEGHLLVVERGGTIQQLDPASGNTNTFLDLSDRVVASSGDGELGLLGMAFHPDYPADPRFFLNYTTDPDDLDYTATTHISSFEAQSSDMGQADSEQVLMHYNQPQSNHNGGMLAFGPDGCLFAGAGDGGNSNDQGFGHAPGGNGQQLNTPLAKILRIDVDNPDKAAPGNLDAEVPQIWDYGTRNPWRFSFDSMTGDLYIGDVGQGAHEEVDVEARGKGHFNYGWPIVEGLDCMSGGCDMNGLTLPVDAYDHVMNQIDCVIGGYVYRGKKIESLQGWYVYGDNGPAGKIRTFVWDGDGRCADTIVLSDRDGIQLDSDITSFGQDAAGELYITTHTSVYRIEAN